MPNPRPLDLIRPELRAMGEPGFLRDREVAVEKGCTDFASSIDHRSPQTLYPPYDLTELREHVASVYSPSATLPVDSVLITRGASEGIDLALRAALRPGVDKVAFPTPTFAMYRYWAQVSGIESVGVPLLGADKSELDSDALCATGAKLLFICQPNSPTGIPFAVDEIWGLLKSFAGMVVVDEAYADFCPEFSVVPLLSEFPNLVVLKSFSKSWGLAGARLGCVLAHPALIQAFRTLQGPFGTPTPSEQLLIKTIQEPDSRTAYLEYISDERPRVLARLRATLPVSKVYPSSTNFVLFEHSMGEKTHAALSDLGFFLNDCSSVAPGALRLSLRSRRENDAVIDALSELD